MGSFQKQPREAIIILENVFLFMPWSVHQAISQGSDCSVDDEGWINAD